MTNTTTPTANERPYNPSLIDRFNDWVAGLPIPAWALFGLLGLELIVVQGAFLWLEGGLQHGELLPIIIFNALFTPFLLALIYLLDNQAVTALNAMRPVLATTEPGFDRYAYRLSTMPFPLPLVIGLSMVVLVVLMEQLATTPLPYAALERSRIFAVVFQVVDKSSAFLFGVFIFHTIRQLRLVTAINANHVRISLFNLRPLQAFSTLTASTAVGLVVGVYGWMLINPELWADPVILGFVVIISILAVAVFVWPLYGVHRLMVAAKERALHEIDHRFEAVFSAFNVALRDGDYAATEELSGTIASL
ncbi:MAG: hypothetical protein PVG25_12785, partial [Anaerolineae bacterium]